MASKGIVTNVSNNPISLPDGSMIGPGETVEDFDESSLKDDLFLKSGWLVVGKDAKEIQSQLDVSEGNVEALNLKIAELQEALKDAELRAGTAEAALADAKAKK